MKSLSTVLLIVSLLQFFITPPGIGIPAFFFLLILASAVGEIGMSKADQARVLKRKRLMDRYGASH